MGKPSAPEPPDPQETASAQTGQNVMTAIANAQMGNVNQVTPYGNLTYDQTGTMQMADPNNPEAVYDIPSYTATQTLSPGQQAILDEFQLAQLGLAQAATTAAGNVQGALSTPLDLSTLPSGGTYDPAMQPELMQFDFSQTPELMTNPFTQQGPGASGNIGTVSNITPTLSMGRVSAPGGGGSVSYNRSDLGDIQSEFGNTQNDVAYEFGQGQDIGNLQTVTDLLNGLEIDYTPSGDFGEIQNTYNGDFSEDRQRVEDALMDRMNPILDRDRERLEARLASQGLRYGAEAYQDAFGDFNRQSNDARLAAILNAGQEQSRLVNMERDRAAFFNSAQNQEAQQMLAREGLDMQGQIANADLQFSRANADSRFGLDRQQQEFDQLLSRGNFFNDAQGQDFDQQYTRGQFANDAQAQGAGQTLEQDRMDLQAQTSNQSSANAAAGRNLQAALANQDAALQEARFGLDAQQQQFMQALGAGQFYNDASQQDFLNYQAGLGTFNNTAQQDYQNYLTGLDAQDLDRNQSLQEQLTAINQPINQATALLGATQVQNPNFVNPNISQMPTTDYAGIVADNYQAQLAAYNAQQSGWNNIMGGLLGAGGQIGAAAFSDRRFSDRRLKRDIRQVSGGVLPTYEYRYVWDDPGTVRRGYMAQDALKVAPWAVRQVGKWLALDYAQLPEVS